MTLLAFLVLAAALVAAHLNRRFRFDPDDCSGGDRPGHRAHYPRAGLIALAGFLGLDLLARWGYATWGSLWMTLASVGVLCLAIAYSGRAVANKMLAHALAWYALTSLLMWSGADPLYAGIGAMLVGVGWEWSQRCVRVWDLVGDAVGMLAAVTLVTFAGGAS